MLCHAAYFITHQLILIGVHIMMLFLPEPTTATLFFGIIGDTYCTKEKINSKRYINTALDFLKSKVDSVAWTRGSRMKN
jgi:hypothetical protein